MGDCQRDASPQVTPRRTPLSNEDSSSSPTSSTAIPNSPAAAPSSSTSAIAAAMDILVKKKFLPVEAKADLPTISSVLRSIATKSKTYSDHLQAVASILEHLSFERVTDIVKPTLDQLGSIALDLHEEETALHSQLDDIKTAHKISRSLISQQETLLDQLTAVSTQVQAQVTAFKTPPAASSYSSALLSVANLSPHSGPTTDPRFLHQLISRQCQVLVDASIDFTSNVSLDTLTARTRELLAEGGDGCPLGASVDSLQKLRNGGLVLRFNSKETADWARLPVVRERLLALFGPGAVVKTRGYLLVVPWIPLHFEPDRESDLREVEVLELAVEQLNGPG